MRVKYMGSADVRRVDKGTDFGGRLATPLDRGIEWTWENNHVIDTADYEGVDDEFWTLLLEEPDFRDVSDLKRIPTNEAQQIWRGMPKSVEDVPAATAASGTAETSTSSAGGGTGSPRGARGGTTTTTSGSTRGSA